MEPLAGLRATDAVAELVGSAPSLSRELVLLLYVEFGRSLPAFAGPFGAAGGSAFPLLPILDLCVLKLIVLPNSPFDSADFFSLSLSFSESPPFEDRNVMDMALPSRLDDSSPFFFSGESGLL